MGLFGQRSRAVPSSRRLVLDLMRISRRMPLYPLERCFDLAEIDVHRRFLVEGGQIRKALGCRRPIERSPEEASLLVGESLPQQDAQGGGGAAGAPQGNPPSASGIQPMNSKVTLRPYARRKCSTTGTTSADTRGRGVVG
jgi:hypothetical protein